MGPTTILLALLAVIATCWAEVISLRSRNPNALSTERLTIRNLRHEYRFLPPLLGSTDTGDGDDFQLLDVVLVASVDGNFHALNRTSGQALWSMASSSPSSVPSELAPLVL